MTWLDCFIAGLRFRKVVAMIPHRARVLDLGCGYDVPMLRMLADKIMSGVGIDLQVAQLLDVPNIKLIKSRIDTKLPLKDGEFDVVTAAAVIEHVEYPELLLKEAYRVLRPNGRIIVTTPSKYGKLPLEMAARLGWISQAEIADHKRYYESRTLTLALHQAGFRKIRIKRFTPTLLNLIAVAERPN